MIKNVLLGIFFTIIVGLAAWTTLFYHPAKIKKQVAATPDAYMENVVAIIMDKQGKPSMKIITPKMIHYAENDVSQLNNPQLTLYRKSPIPWHVTSHFAKTMGGIDHIEFWQDVVLHHPADLNDPATLIKTPTLSVFPNEKLASTQDFITLIQPNMTVKATGMNADLNSGDIKLISAARGEYAPG